MYRTLPQREESGELAFCHRGLYTEHMEKQRVQTERRISVGKYYMYEVDYRCVCEECGKEFRGIIRRGPLEYNGGVIPTGMAGALDAADMKLSKS